MQLLLHGSFKNRKSFKIYITIAKPLMSNQKKTLLTMVRSNGAALVTTPYPITALVCLLELWETTYAPTMLIQRRPIQRLSACYSL